MPCYYTGSAEGDARLGEQEAHKAMTKVTRLLCQQCRYLDKTNSAELMPPAVKRWWKTHKDLDATQIT